MKKITLILIFNIVFTSTLLAETKSKEVSVPKAYALKCFKSQSANSKIAKSFGFDLQKLTERQKKILDLFCKSYCICETNAVKSAGKLTREVTKLSSGDFIKFQNDFLKTSQGKKVFKKCDDAAMSAVKAKFSK
ncbi:MAG: hypothetical protein CME65_05775 [Halobacteriovoraceae bacterium]|nr:hypothetical protein [Halobacteriovoraceae bacterium]|tara:strand:+ start:21928 stop:22329 length:402 start_codon:yes stop_codon:yes gene_type:complete